MRKREQPKFGDLEMQIMNVLWERGPSTVRDVAEALSVTPPPAYTTVLTVLQKLEKAGWLAHRAEGKSYIYLPKASREEAGAGSVRGFLKRVFEGDAVAMFQHLIRESELSDEDLSELRAMIDEKRKERKP